GTWTDLLTGAVYPGGKETVLPAPMDHIPALLRAGAILPMLRDTIDTLAPATEPSIESFVTSAGPLWVAVTRFGSGATRDFTLYDGTILTLTEESTAGTTTLTLSAQGGTVYDVDLVVELIGPTADGAESAGSTLPAQTAGATGPGLYALPQGSRAVLPAGARAVTFSLPK
ncbi:MAG: hypothetical protein IV100_30210, partial [Myxococcales bacterium]|nr:hypothetical protein [Myxococcales bacterium]